MEEKTGWATGVLEDFGCVVSGGTPSTKKAEYWGGDIAWVSPKDLSGYTKKYIAKGQKNITERGLANSSARLIPKDSVLFSSRAPIGYTAIAANDICTNQGFKSLIPNVGVESEFIYYYFKSIKQLAEKRGSGTTFNELSASAFAQLPIDIPPLPEQRAIVVKIEQLFSELDAGITSLKKAQEQLKIYRQAVLKKAFTGDWNMIALDQISEAIGGWAFKSSDFVANGKYQVIRIGNVRPGLFRLKESPVFINETEAETPERCRLKKGDVVISLTGTRKKRDYGFTALVESDDLLLNQRLALLRFSDNCLPKFFLFYSWTDAFKDQFFRSETGNVGQGNVGMKAIRSTQILLPSVGEQHHIVQEIETCLSVCDNVEANIKEALFRAKALRQSILKKSFEGKLLSDQELQEAHNAPDWEPAEKLLARILRGKNQRSGISG